MYLSVGILKETDYYWSNLYAYSKFKTETQQKGGKSAPEATLGIMGLGLMTCRPLTEQVLVMGRTVSLHKGLYLEMGPSKR